MEEIYQAALKKRTRVESLRVMNGKTATATGSDPPAKVIKCHNCQEEGHYKSACTRPKKKAQFSRTEIKTGDKKPGSGSGSDSKDSKCPICAKVHTWKPKDKKTLVRSKKDWRKR